MAARASKFPAADVREIVEHLETCTEDKLEAFIDGIMCKMPGEDEDGNEDEDLQDAASKFIDQMLRSEVMIGVKAFSDRLVKALVELKATEPTPTTEICILTRTELSPLAREIVDHIVKCFLDWMAELIDDITADMPGDEDELLQAAHDFMQNHLKEEVMVYVKAFADQLQTELFHVEKTRREARAARKKTKKNKTTRDCMICVGGGECVRHAKKAKA